MDNSEVPAVVWNSFRAFFMNVERVAASVGLVMEVRNSLVFVRAQS
jgi:hypothetical protein